MSINFSSWPSFTQEEAEATNRVLLSNNVNYWTGQETRCFEREFATWCKSNYAIAVANGTVALDLALVGLRIGSHNGGRATDEVIVTPRTFFASASTVVNAGAVPIFADVDRDSGNLTAANITEHLTANTKAIIVVHLAGWPCDMDPIMALAKRHNLKVIEDCAQAHGARYKGQPVGSIGDVGAWSFCQDKIMTTGGEGGMVTTNCENLWSTMWSYKDHGKSWDAVYNRKHAPGFRWLHESFGTNWRMIEIQAAIGRIQLSRMPVWSKQRQNNASEIAMALQDFSGNDGPIRIPKFKCFECSKIECVDFSKGSCDRACNHAYYKFYFYIKTQNLAPDWNRNRVIQEITSRGVPCFQGSCSEVYLERAFRNPKLNKVTRLPIARELGETSLMLLVHPTLTRVEIEKTISVLHSVLDKCKRK